MDQLSGGEGNDFINGGADADTMHGGAGDDVIWFEGATERPADGGVYEIGVGGTATTPSCTTSSTQVRLIRRITPSATPAASPTSPTSERRHPAALPER